MSKENLQIQTTIPMKPNFGLMVSIQVKHLISLSQKISTWQTLIHNFNLITVTLLNFLFSNINFSGIYSRGKAHVLRLSVPIQLLLSAIENLDEVCYNKLLLMLPNNTLTIIILWFTILMTV